MSRFPLPGVALASLALVAASAPAQAVPTARVVDDKVEPGKAYDIVSVSLKSQKKETTKAKVVVTHGREVKTGDSIELWFDLDDDAVPDIHLSGDSFSEYSYSKTTSFTEDGKDISNKGCMDLKMVQSRSVVRFDPGCLKAGTTTYAVSVQSSRSDKPDRADDFAPAPLTFTKKVLSGPLA